MRPKYKKLILLMLDVILLVYVFVAMISFNKPDESKNVCTEVNIVIADQNANGFLTANEVKKLMKDSRMYPLNFRMTDIQPRLIEDLLCKSPFVKTAECYKTKDNKVFVSITQRLPVIRIKSERGDDYYLDDKGGIMPNTSYTSDLIIATGNIRQSFARNYIAPMANIIMANDLWKNLIEQINVLPDGGIEIVPRIGDHVVFLGYMPQTRYASKRKEKIEAFVNTKLTRLEKFYKYGLSQVGWNKYPYISLEFDNQIICKKDRNAKSNQETTPQAPQQEQKPDANAPAAQQSDDNHQEKPQNDRQKTEKNEAEKNSHNTRDKKTERKEDNRKKSDKAADRKTDSKRSDSKRSDSKKAADKKKSSEKKADKKKSADRKSGSRKSTDKNKRS